MEKIIVEVGSTNTKIDLAVDGDVKHLETITIEFKKNFKKENKLNSNDIEVLINKVKELEKEYKEIYVCGTSIFRNLNENERKEFLDLFFKRTEINFEIIDSKKENELTVFGCVRNVKQKVAVLVGGGGSTEITIFDKEIKEMINTPFGVMDIMNEFPDLAENLATTDLEEVKAVIRKHLKLPKEKADILILAGGGHLLFALNSGISYEKNTLYQDKLQPVMMNFNTRQKDTVKYFREISLDEIRKKVSNPDWWYATRAMCVFVLVVAEEIGAKYIVPTDISMVYGLTKEGE